MKYIVLIIMLLSTISGKAQKIHFSDKTNHWMYTMGTFEGCEGRIYRGYGRDSILNGVNYQTLVDTLVPYVVWGTMTGGCFGAQYINLFIREDILAGKVYCRNPRSDTVERLLFDYNLHIGDSMSNYGDMSTTYRYHDTVYAIDSTLIGTTYHKIFYLTDAQYGSVGLRNNVFVEGIGSLNWIHAPLYTYYFEYLETIQCFSTRGYNPVFNIPCPNYMGTVISDTFKNNIGCSVLGLSDPSMTQNIQLSPNPAYSEITITSPELINELIITNLTGQVVSNLAPKNISASIAVNNFPSGMYIVEIRTGNSNERRSFRRFIKE